MKEADIKTIKKQREISGSHNDKYEYDSLLGYSAM
jgi:hypothetical protein